MSDILTQPALSLVASAIGALLAGYYGVRFGLRQYRAERAMDRRLAWYSELAEVTQKLLNRNRSLQFFIAEGGAPKSVKGLLDELAALSFRFQELAMMAEFYAAPDTVEVIEQTLSLLDRLGGEMSRGHDAGKRDGAAQESIRVIHAASRLLARDVRREFGLEPLRSHKAFPHADE